MTKAENQLTYKRDKHMLITNISWDVFNDKYDEDELNDLMNMDFASDHSVCWKKNIYMAIGIRMTSAAHI